MPTKIQSVDISKSVWPVLQTYKHLLASPSIQYILYSVYGGGGGRQHRPAVILYVYYTTFSRYHTAVHT